MVWGSGFCFRAYGLGDYDVVGWLDQIRLCSYVCHEYSKQSITSLLYVGHRSTSIKHATRSEVHGQLRLVRIVM